jgi:hypothetical protein
MCSSNYADQHAHFPGRAAASIRRALNYDLSRYTIPSDSLQTLQSRLQQDLFQLAPPPLLLLLLLLLLPLLRRICGGRFFVLFRCLSCNEAISLE